MRKKSIGKNENIPTSGSPLSEGFGSVLESTTTFSSSKWSFDGVLRRVLGFSKVARLEGKPRARDVDGQRAAALALTLFVKTLDAPTRDKLRTVIRAGRDARALAEARSSLVGEALEVADENRELFVDGSVSLQHLQRGHAIACATSFDLELELASWAPTGDRLSLDERVWLRFGRELALSDSAEWSCLAVVDTKQRLDTLYLRRGQQRWWSFDSVIDRPSASEMTRRRAARVKERKLVTLPLEAVVGRRCCTGRRAVSRAALAMSARLGHCRMPSNEATASS